MHTNRIETKKKENSMSYSTINFDIKDRIAVITFNRPEVLNALNAELIEDLWNAFDTVSENEEIRVLVLTGAGPKSFMAGADITELAKMGPLQAKALTERVHALFLKLETLPQPVIAAVNGFALGAGNEAALACDFIYASETAKFGMPEINLGLIPGYGGTQRLPRLIGKNLAKEMIFTGKMISAAESEKMGFVNRVVAPDMLMEEVMKTANIIADKGRVALRAAKQSVDSGANTDLRTGISIEISNFAMAMASPDAKEGTRAFLEKRKPVFKGRLNN
jgi:enoyl-CoA hydratase